MNIQIYNSSRNYVILIVSISFSSGCICNEVAIERRLSTAKGSVRKEGKKWYYRYYVEDASGNKIQKECVSPESKAEMEKLLRKTMEDYEEKLFVAKTNTITLADLLDM